MKETILSLFFLSTMASVMSAFVSGNGEAVSETFQSTMVKAKDGSGVFGYKDTRKLPWCGFFQHDPDRPLPPIVKSCECQIVEAPSDALILFDGRNLSQWQNSTWQIDNGELVSSKTKEKLITKRSFGDIQMHVEWLVPADYEGPWYNHGNNGVTLMNLYEIQIFDSYNYKIPLYADGICSAIYGQTPPTANACLKPGEWQSFDIIFTAPRFKDGELVKPAYLTLIHNGVIVHNNQEIYGETRHRIYPEYNTKVSEGPISLPGHDCPVRFRNIWVRNL